MLASERVATVGVLAASIAHDMANIVSPIRLFVKMLLDGRPLSDEARDALQCQIERLTTLTERLLGLSKGRYVDLQPTDLNTSVHNALGLMGTELTHRHIALELDLAQAAACGRHTARSSARCSTSSSTLRRPGRCRTSASRCAPRWRTATLSSACRTRAGIDDVQKLLGLIARGAGRGWGCSPASASWRYWGTLEIDSRVGAGTTMRVRLPALSPDGSEVS